MAESMRNILSIQQLTRLIKMKLESEPYLQELWVRGEISNFGQHTSGHLYFSLKDADTKIKCVMFSSYRNRLPFLPQNGSLVIVRGHITVYEKDGIYQLFVTSMQPDGLGSLHLAFEQLKAKLESEGLFDAKRKKPLPTFPKAIGVITSPTGAAVHDIVTTIKRRFPSVYVLVCPVLVQGDQAADSIAKAIERMNAQKDIELLIVGRGGGSIEELWAFNEEKVARAIFHSKIPIISAVGHETDYTIADFVADLRAATPTAAAELAVPQAREVFQHIEHLHQRISNKLTSKVRNAREKLEQWSRSPFLVSPHRWLLLQPSQRLDRADETMRLLMNQHVSQAQDRRLRLKYKLDAHHPLAKTTQFQKRLETLRHILNMNMQNSIQRKTFIWQTWIRQLDALSPLKVMQRGYSLVYNEEQTQCIRSIHHIHSGDVLKIQLLDGRLFTQVLAKEEQTNE